MTIDGVVQKKAALQVPDGAKVMWNNELLQLIGPTYLMMHKPLD
ncbi:MAG TPA: 16S rRNA pseudouridine(516) synthase, partial [Pseudomonas sp.]|nr:16S rRNA pseudouridine(516) synthase [Pseudomonas sp.]